MELKAHGHNLFYYDNKKNGEVDFLIDDYYALGALVLEMKSGKDYTVHSELNRLLENDDYRIKAGYEFRNSREVRRVGRIVYLPVYYVMFFAGSRNTDK